MLTGWYVGTYPTLCRRHCPPTNIFYKESCMPTNIIGDSSADISRGVKVKGTVSNSILCKDIKRFFFPHVFLNPVFNRTEAETRVGVLTLWKGSGGGLITQGGGGGRSITLHTTSLHVYLRCLLLIVPIRFEKNSHSPLRKLRNCTKQSRPNIPFKANTRVREVHVRLTW